MTAAMEALHRRLPERERFPLPPRLITEQVVDRLGATDVVTTARDEQLVAAVSHFTYGAAAGIAYSLAASSLPRPPFVSGVLWGLTVWAFGYLGWLPLTGIRPLPSKLPPRREAVMVATHLVFGVSIALTYAALTGSHGRSTTGD